ncbi:alpha/beta hydrolase [Streptomyces klenkii]|uniref:alpha/beta hydrolase n=1 Tax=Streptomyces klenkii TaxID=1420899 RepID=UPI003F689922
MTATPPDERPESPVHIDGQGPSNVLMVQNERAPGTPRVGAEELRRAFGRRARSVTAEPTQHGGGPEEFLRAPASVPWGSSH